jgi:D-3-phosphoglycerate dehydrogenase
MEDGHLGGAAIDVPDPEPLPDDHPIRSAPNTILTPHAAWFSEASFPRLESCAIAEVVRALSGKRPRNVVNGPNLPRRAD